MTAPLPTFVDPQRLATARRLLAGRLDLSKMERLAPYLQSTQGEVAIEAAFDFARPGVPCIKGSVQARLLLQCQRCLGEMVVVVDKRIAYGLVASNAQAQTLAAEYEPFVLDGEEPLRLADVFEDELILALPLVARHGEGERCELQRVYQDPALATENQEQGQGRRSPFAALAELKSKK